jgi:DNA-binding beta-propeller fold protein YncE
VAAPSGGSGSVVLYADPPWTAAANASWLHLSPANQAGPGSANVVYTIDANPGATRTGTLTIAGRTLTVTQAGASYVAAQGLTPLVSAGLGSPEGLAVDGAGNVYIADQANNAVKEYQPASQTVTNLVSTGLNAPSGVAVDWAGNVYIADQANNAVKEYQPASQTVTNLVSTGLNRPRGVGVDAAGNVYIADHDNAAIEQLMADGQAVSTLVSSNTANLALNGPEGVALDAAGNVYIADDAQGIAVWNVGSQSPTTLAPPSELAVAAKSVAVDGAGNVYFPDRANTGIKMWNAASQTVVPVVTSGLAGPAGVAVDGAGNLYVSDDVSNTVLELPRAFVDPTPRIEPAQAGADSLSPVAPTTANLSGPFAPASDQPWLTIAGVTNGVVSFAFTGNFGPARTGHINMLGVSIAVTQEGMPPVITSQPVSQTVTNGFPASFSVAVAGSAPLGYQWLFNGTNLVDGTNPASGAQTAGSAKPNLKLYKTQPAQAGNYTVVVTNAFGSVTSAVATLTVNLYPAITRDPTNQIVLQGRVATFSAAATGTPNLVYHWFFQKTNALVDSGAFRGSATPTLTISNAQAANAGAYSVLVTNLFGAARSASGQLTVNIPPAITNQPVSQTVTNGYPASFNVAAAGAAPLGYQWLFNGTTLVDGAETKGSASPVLRVFKAQPAQAGNYTVVVTNAFGSVTSAVATLTVGVYPVITRDPTNQIVLQGGVATFSAAATGTPNLVYNWFFQKTNALIDGGAYRGSATPTLTISNAQAANAGPYSVLVTNLFGAAQSASAHLLVIRPPSITIASPFANQTLTNSNWVAAGSTSDNGPVTNVLYRLDGGGWQQAQTTNGWTNWTAQLALAQGTNTLQAYAVNSLGGASSNAQAVFVLAKPSHPLFRQAASPAEILIVLAQAAGGKVQLELSSPTACSVLVQASEDLVNWVPIASRALPAGESVTVEDSMSTSARFYRAVLQQ